MRLRVIEVYGQATLQDAGRPGWRARGVPPGGAFDRDSLALANAMVGNPPDVPALELGLGTVVLDAPEGAVFAVVGSESRVVVDTRSRPTPGRIRVREGALLEIGVGVSGARLYLAMPGGVVGHPELGSVSGQRVAARFELVAAAPSWMEDAQLARVVEPLALDELRVLPGPRRGLVPGLDLAGPWRVRPQIDRVGVRLHGEAPRHGIELPSEPMCVGAVQAAPNGGLLILGPDGPTIGGYPHVATVIRADIARVAQLRPGQSVRLVQVDLDQARLLWNRSQEELRRLLAQLAIKSDPHEPGT